MRPSEWTDTQTLYLARIPIYCIIVDLVGKQAIAFSNQYNNILEVIAIEILFDVQWVRTVT